mmetsp:Transcript_62963/g.172566  ORF Transcript_62963/g.172566 Transcript_62963/m.172566 type:complete len:416 (+) Transcript_62963:2897-4144(+)
MGVGDSRELRDVLASLPTRDGDGSDGDNGGGKSKIVYLVRHTRSEQNSGARQFTEGHCCLGFYKMACGFDAPPSKRGFEMLEERATPVGNFLTPRVECVFFSPLKRAEVTKTAVFGEYEGAPKDTSAVEVEVEVEGGGNQTIEKPPQVPLWFLKERSKRETCGPSCHLSNRVHRFDVEFLRRVPMDTFALVGHSVFFRQLVFGSMHPGEAGLLMGNIDTWCIEVPPLDEPEARPTLRATYTTNETLEAMPQTLDGLIDLIHLALLVHQGTCQVYLDYRAEGDPPSKHRVFQTRVAGALDGERVRYLSTAPATVKRADQTELQRRLDAEGLDVEEVKAALRTLSEKATFAPNPSTIGGSGGDSGGDDGGGDGGGGGVVTSQPQQPAGGADVEAGGKWRGVSVDDVGLTGNEREGAP